MYKSGVVTVTAAPQTLQALGIDESAQINIFNYGAAEIFSGGAGVTTADGYPLAAQSERSFLGDFQNIYLVAAANNEIRWETL